MERHKRRLSDLIKQQQQLAHTMGSNSETSGGDAKEEEEESGNSSELQLLADDRLKELQELQTKFEYTVKVENYGYCSCLRLFDVLIHNMIAGCYMIPLVNCSLFTPLLIIMPLYLQTYNDIAIISLWNHLKWWLLKEIGCYPLFTIFCYFIYIG